MKKSITSSSIIAGLSMGLVAFAYIYFGYIFFHKKALPLDANGITATEYPSSQTMYDDLDKVANFAQTKHDPTICSHLPLLGAYYYGRTWYESDGYTGIPLRASCYYRFMLESPTNQLCKLMAKMPETDWPYTEPSYATSYPSYPPKDCFKYAASAKQTKKILR